ncbi:MAG TPA: methylated-DNA--[protein]-cysteine S-methyltransferase [Thermoanaerobaculia bacterium]|jgi:methylated-DNA-[protein]-cysteine S-methyltransferase
MTDYAAILDSPIGPLTVVVDDAGRLTRIEFEKRFLGVPRSSSGSSATDPRNSEEPEELNVARCAHVITQLNEYFNGKRTTFDVTLELRGTEFQKAVWNELLNVPYGATISYGELARRIGRPDAVRAVGSANGANPVPIIVPCHRIIGANGTLTGYGGGLPRKQQLLALEARESRLF